jgi:hypothetical protein
MGEAVAFFLNGLSFLAVIFSLLLMRGCPQISRREEEDPHVVRHMMNGVRFVIGQQTILILMSLVAVSSFLSRPYQTLMPVFADISFRASTQPVISLLCENKFVGLNCRAPAAILLGILLSAVGIGAVVGALLVASLPANARRGRMLTIGNISFPLFLLLFVNSSSLLAAVALMLLVGMSHVFQNSLANTLLQLTAPDQLRGRVMSLYSLVSQGMTHMGGLQAGLVADWLGAPLSVGVGAALSLLYGFFIAIRYPQIRNLA